MSDKEPTVLRTIADCEAWLRENDPGTEAYDGSTSSAKRELTARERDILFRILLAERRRLAEEEREISRAFMRGEDSLLVMPGMNNVDRVHIEVMLDVLNPRRDDERCKWCDDHDTEHRRPGSKPFSAWVGPEVDGDGQPTTIHVSYSACHHVSELEAEYVREALRAYRRRTAESAALRAIADDISSAKNEPHDPHRMQRWATSLRNLAEGLPPGPAPTPGRSENDD